MELLSPDGLYHPPSLSPLDLSTHSHKVSPTCPVSQSDRILKGIEEAADANANANEAPSIERTNHAPCQAWGE